jgi:hypothetical protein
MSPGCVRLKAFNDAADARVKKGQEEAFKILGRILETRGPKPLLQLFTEIETIPSRILDVPFRSGPKIGHILVLPTPTITVGFPDDEMVTILELDLSEIQELRLRHTITAILSLERV